MFDLSEVSHNPVVEDILSVLQSKTHNADSNFFRVEVAYFLAKIASNMRAYVSTKDRGNIPVNIYALALAPSGFGKGHSINIMENEFLYKFKSKFLSKTMPYSAEKNIWDIATKKAAINSTEQEDEREKAEKEYNRAGAYPFTFDSGTPPAVKQLRHKLLMAQCGAVSLQIDEIGSNLLGSDDLLILFLELYDQGYIKQKLIKNTNDNVRVDELEGKTPTNMLLFGTPVKLMNGGQTEEHFYSFLEVGYARRCLFSYGTKTSKLHADLTAEELYYKLIQPSNSDIIKKWSNHFRKLGDNSKLNWKMDVADEVAILLLKYRMECDKHADELAEHKSIEKAELGHRYFKALKLAGVYAFIDEAISVSEEHLMQAIKLVEESGEAFKKLLDREPTYEKLARYIASQDSEVTHADLVEALPFYKSSNTYRTEMITLATAWGYKNNILIKNTHLDGIEFFSGESLKETNLDEIILSYSDHEAYGYKPEVVPFNKLHKLTQAKGMHWCNHAFLEEHRKEDNTIMGCNMIVLDIDGDSSLKNAHKLLKQYTFMTYTTKRSTPEVNRFRLMIPINYHMELPASDYKEFINNIINWLPFDVDSGSNQRSKKWLTNDKGHYYINEGELLDVLPFIPKTTKNEKYTNRFKKLANLDNLERWFIQRMTTGNRNNEMLKYALALVDDGFSLVAIDTKVKEFNNKLREPLDVNEIDKTIMVTVANKFKQ